MAIIKSLVCLANSHKGGMRCVAEMENLDPGKWVRPLGDRDGNAVSESERRYEDGTEPRALDIVSVPLIGRSSAGYHSENWLLDPSRRWWKTAEVRWDQLPSLAQQDKNVWLSDHSSNLGDNDRIPVEFEKSLSGSLKFIRVESVTLKFRPPHSSSYKQTPTLQACFYYGGFKYSFRVAYPVYKIKYIHDGYGDYRLKACYLTLSLSEKFEGYFYKLVAPIEVFSVS